MKLTITITRTPTEKEIDFFRTQGDQKAYYNWFVNVVERTHPLSRTHPLVQHTGKHALNWNKRICIWSKCDTGRCCWLCRCLQQRCTVTGIKVTSWNGGGGSPQEKEMRSSYYNRPQKHSKGVKAGELGYENDPHIMRINNHICSWPFSLPNQINHQRSP